jgi:mannosylglycerate hydrolase MGH1-like protein
VPRSAASLEGTIGEESGSPQAHGDDEERAAERLRELCAATLASNWTEGTREGVEFAYTRPSPERYPWQWYWDSCFAAIVWRRFDRERSRRELETLLAAARADGFIGHTIFWERPVSGVRRRFYNVCSDDDFTTATIQPPMLAWAWRIAVGDPAREPAIVAHHDFLMRERALEGDGLLWLLQPDESGLDDSPQFDPIWRQRAHGLPWFLDLVRRNRKLGFRISAVREAGGPLVCEVTTNVLHNLSQLALGRPSLTPALVERLYDDSSGVFLPRAWPEVDERIPLTWSALSPLALPDLPEAIGRRLVEEHLLSPRFWTAVAPPSVSTDEASFSLRQHTLAVRRYWRGPTWINSSWLVWLGLLRLGYEEQAATLASGVISAVARAGVREFYGPFDGRGMGSSDFAWSTLAVELLEADADAAGSHLGAATS